MNGLCELLIAAIISFQTILMPAGGGDIQPSTEIEASITDTIMVTELSLKEDNPWLKSDLNIPVVSGLKDKNLEEKINDIFKVDALKFKKGIEGEAKDAYEYSKKFNVESPHKYLAETFYKTRYASKDLLSVTVMYHQYTGGAHGLEILKGYNFDLVSGELLNLSDLFAEDFDYSKAIGTEVLSAMKSNPEDYFPIDDNGIKNITGDHPYYLEDGNLVIYYGLYELAPYSSGIPEFRIPFSKLVMRKK